MKKLALSFFLIILSVYVFAQSSDSFNYQAVVRNAAGAAVVSQPVSFRLSILKGSATGSLAYSEKHGVTTNQFGLATLAIGNGTNKTGSFDAIVWGADTYFLKVEIDPSGGTSYVDMGAIQLLSVPYALHAKTANALTGGVTETDPMFAASAANGITGTNITNWTSAFSWGDHTGLYRPISYVPTWSEITGKPTLFDGAWTSLTAKPTTIAGYGITDAFNGTWASLTGKPAFSTVATSGSYNDLSNMPTLFDGAWASLTGKPILFDGQYSSLVGAPALSTVAISGSYTDLANKPTLFSGSFTDLTNKPTTIAGYGITDAFNGTWASLTGKPAFSTVATSGSYNDLSNKPSLFDGTWTSLTGKPTTIAGYGITDAISTAHPANGITTTNITNWNSAFAWGNHASAGYLKTFTETDPVYAGSQAANITSGDITKLSNLSGVNTGDETAATIKTKLAITTLSGTNTGDQDLSGLATTTSVTTALNLKVDKEAGKGLSTEDYTTAEKTKLTAVDGSETKVTAGTNVTVTGAGTTASPYVVNSTSGGGGTHYLGEEYLGGIIFYLYTDATGTQKGLIVSKTENTATWSGSTLVGADRSEDGAYNMNIMPAASPARVWVETLGAGWYLPSIDELSILWHNRFHVNKTARAVSSTLLSIEANYWSSTEYIATYAFLLTFYSGNPGYVEKVYPLSVRAVRAF